MSDYCKIEFDIVAADSLDYQPAKLRVPRIVEAFLVDATRFAEDMQAPISPSTLELGDVAFVGMLIHNRGASGFVTFTWKGQAGDANVQRIPAGRCCYVPGTGSGVQATLSTTGEAISPCDVWVCL